MKICRLIVLHGTWLATHAIEERCVQTGFRLAKFSVVKSSHYRKQTFFLKEESTILTLAPTESVALWVVKNLNVAGSASFCVFSVSFRVGQP